jgi:hypothetical protein
MERNGKRRFPAGMTEEGQGQEQQPMQGFFASLRMTRDLAGPKDKDG